MNDRSRPASSSSLDDQLDALSLALQPDGLAEERGDQHQLEKARKVLGLIQRVRKSKESSEDIAKDHDTVVDQRTTPEQEDLASAESDQQTFEETEGTSTEPRRIGRFTVERQLGQGGYGLVFLAHDPQLDRNVAVKVPRPEAVMNPSLRSRFIREAKAAGSLSHPNIVPVFESGGDGPICFIAYEYIEGITLAEWISSSMDATGTNTHDAARLVATLAEAVHHAHQRGVLHRDLKPANIMLRKKAPELESQDGTADSLTPRHQTSQIEPPGPDQRLPSSTIPMITDFGLAKFVQSKEISNASEDPTRTGAIIGTPAYMSPEQTMARKDEVEARTDIYSLGAILYELLTGKPPFTGPSVLEVINAVQKSDAKSIHSIRPEISRDLEAICFKCLEKNPRNRYASAYQLKQDLERFENGEPVTARPVTSLDRAWRWATRNPGLASSLSVLAVVIVSALVVCSVLLISSEYNRKLAENRGIKLQSEIEAKDTAIAFADLKSNQLKSAFDDLFTSIAMTPEIRIEGTGALREKLLASVNGYYREFSRRQPDDLKSLAQYVGTVNRIAGIKYQLKDYGAAMDHAKQSIELIEQANAQSEELTVAKIKSQLVQAMVLAAQGRKPEFVTTSNNVIELANSLKKDSDDIDATIELALAYSQLSGIASEYGHRTMANDFSIRAVAVWKNVDPAELDQSTTRSMLEAYFIAGYSLASAQRKSEAIELLDFSLGMAEEYFLNDIENEPPTFLSSVAKALKARGFTLIDKDEQSQHYFTKAYELWGRLLERHPLISEYAVQITSLNYSWALSKFVSGHHEDAIQKLTDDLRLFDEYELRFPSAKTDLLRRKADYFALLGYSHRNLKQLDNAVNALQQSRKINEQLVEMTNRSIVSRVQLEGVIGGIAVLEASRENWAIAIDLLDRSNNELRAILKDDPENGECSRFLANNLGHLKTYFGELNQWDKALLAFEESMQFENVLPDAHKKGRRAAIHLHLGDVNSASADYREFVNLPMATNPMQAVEQTRVAINFLETLDAVAENLDGDANELEKFRETAVQHALVRLAGLREHPQIEKTHWRKFSHLKTDSNCPQEIRQWLEENLD